MSNSGDNNSENDGRRPSSLNLSSLMAAAAVAGGAAAVAGGAAAVVGGTVALAKFVKSSNDCTANSSDALSTQMEQFFQDKHQTIDTYESKVRLKNALLSIILTVFPNSKLFIVGSSTNGFKWDESDVDLCLVISSEAVRRRGGNEGVLQIISSLLRRRSEVKECVLIPANVPILSFLYQWLGIKCDLNVNSVMGIYNTHLLAMYARVDHRLPALGTFVKHWAQKMDIHGGNKGRLSTYALMPMVIQYLQCGCSPPVVPNLQARFPKFFDCKRALKEVDMELKLPWDELRSANRSTLGELFAGFMAYYADFDFARWAISICSGKPLAVDMAIQRLLSDGRAFMIFVEEPFVKGNVAHTVSDKAVFGAIRLAFSRTAEVLQAQKPLESLWKDEAPRSPLLWPLAARGTVWKKLRCQHLLLQAATSGDVPKAEECFMRGGLQVLPAPPDWCRFHSAYNAGCGIPRTLTSPPPPSNTLAGRLQHLKQIARLHSATIDAVTTQQSTFVPRQTTSRHHVMHEVHLKLVWPTSSAPLSPITLQ
ncbi:poly(A) RNA polymerase gld 2 A [Echinococcus multilocularis]|uniref:Poly(A) RNA polymerase gld 2 A n=1 Tax=Echinococcus multilocularis TaxID=6211 RepID=A0A068XVB9_ECHMU|nr:poly(A) RNA polymerase gld 2 A [Echinococcus multilocularis]